MRRTCLKTSQSLRRKFSSHVCYHKAHCCIRCTFTRASLNSVRNPVLHLVNIHFNIILSDCLFLSGFPTNILYTVPVVELTLRYFPATHSVVQLFLTKSRLLLLLTSLNLTPSHMPKESKPEALWRRSPSNPQVSAPFLVHCP
jgi:hypothetical protein